MKETESKKEKFSILTTNKIKIFDVLNFIRLLEPKFQTAFQGIIIITSVLMTDTENISEMSAQEEGNTIRLNTPKCKRIRIQEVRDKKVLAKQNHLYNTSYTSFI